MATPQQIVVLDGAGRKVIVDAEHPLPVTSIPTGGIASDVNVTDRATRDLGKVDVAGIDAIGAAAGQAVMAASLPVAIASNQSAVPIRGYCDRFDVALTLDTNIYATGDVLAATQEVASVFVNSNPAVLYDIRVLDEDDQGTAIDILFLRSDTSIGTENLAYAPADAVGREILKKVSIAAGDWVDEGAWRSAYKSLVDGIGCVLKPTTGTSLYIAAVNRSGTPTFTAAGVRVQFGVIQNG